MSTVTINPISFDSKKGEVIIDKEIIKWKKQKATLSKKKNVSAIDYLNTNYVNLINNGKGGIVFSSFDYNDDTTMYLIYSPDTHIKTELNYDLYIPSLNTIEMVEESYDIEQTDEKIIIQGKVYGLCLDNKTYYFKTIYINEYIEFVQRNNTINDEDLYSEYNLDTFEEEGDDDGDDDFDVDDDEIDVNDDEDDEDENNENEVDIDIDVDVEVDVDEGDDVDDVDECDEGDEVDEVDEVIDFEDPVIDDEGEDLINLDIDDDIIKPKRKKRVTKTNKLTKSINSDDLNILTNILKEEDKNSITPESELNIKRQQSLKILKKIKLPYKTIEIIEKGIYNYTINKCYIRQKIPLWDNYEFVDIYVNKVRNIYLNLNSKEYIKNINLVEKVRKNEIQPYDLAFIDTHKLFPEIWGDIIDEKTKIEKMLRESLEESASDLFECPRCHKNKTIHCEVQTRSSDEPMTTFITCLECGKKWKIY